MPDLALAAFATSANDYSSITETLSVTVEDSSSSRTSVDFYDGESNIAGLTFSEVGADALAYTYCEPNPFNEYWNISCDIVIPRFVAYDVETIVYVGSDADDLGNPRPGVSLGLVADHEVGHDLGLKDQYGSIDPDRSVMEGVIGDGTGEYASPRTGLFEQDKFAIIYIYGLGYEPSRSDDPDAGDPAAGVDP